MRGVRIAVDAMGGDYAPEVNLKGAILALAEDPNLCLFLVGDRNILLEGLKKQGAKESDRLTVIHSDEVVSMGDHATAVVRKKKNSSIHQALRLVKDRTADAFISAGNSGAVMAGALTVLGRLADVERPAIVIKIPTAEGHIIILDAGANVDCRPSHLAQFAEMGYVYAKVIAGIPEPRIGLLSNGSEETKGNELTRESHTLIKKLNGINYLGYVEGYDLFSGGVDVVVCDGFVGNVILKLSEGLADTAYQWFRKEIRRDLLGMMGVVLMRKVLHKFKNKFDYQPYGAAPLLGINGMVLISHGGSTEIAIRNGILTAKRGVQEKFIEKISAHLERQRRKGPLQEVTKTP